MSAWGPGRCSWSHCRGQTSQKTFSGTGLLCFLTRCNQGTCSSLQRDVLCINRKGNFTGFNHIRDEIAVHIRDEIASLILKEKKITFYLWETYFFLECISFVVFTLQLPNQCICLMEILNQISGRIFKCW